jgi:hypothetical protein
MTTLQYTLKDFCALPKICPLVRLIAEPLFLQCSPEEISEMEYIFENSANSESLDERVISNRLALLRKYGKDCLEICKNWHESNKESGLYTFDDGVTKDDYHIGLAASFAYERVKSDTSPEYDDADDIVEMFLGDDNSNFLSEYVYAYDTVVICTNEIGKEGDSLRGWVSFAARCFVESALRA